ncbi:MAG TPA: 5'-3' exonuclease H3TH domain-containing protein, partial [Limnochordales bacterium]
MGETLVLIDGYSLLHRAFYALPMLTTTAGEPTNAIFGFATMLVRLLEEERPQYAAVAVDMAAPTFRHRRFEAYKAHRPSMPDPLRSQVARLEQLLRAFALPVYGAEGYEADDVIGTLTRQALESRPGCHVLIVTGDRDTLQLVGERVTALITRKGIKEVERFTPQRVREVLGIEPAQIPELKGLVGDASDNIPGVPGIGEKTALQLLQRYGSLESMLAHLPDLPGRVARALSEHRDQAVLSRYLATIVTEAPVRLEWEACRLREPDAEALARLFVELEFRSLLGRLGKLYPQVAQAARRTGRTPPPAAGAQSAAAGPGEPAGALPPGADGAPLAVPVAPAGAAGEGEVAGEAPPRDGTRPRSVRRAVALPAAPFGPPRLVRGH